MATAEQVALLRATVEGDSARAKELSNSLNSKDGLEGYDEVVAAAFYLAVHKQFPDRYRTEDVVRLVAETRAMVDVTGDIIDPRTAELVVRGALGQEGVLDETPPARIVEAEVAICSYLGKQRKLGDPDEFMREVEQLLAEWAKDDEPR